MEDIRKTDPHPGFRRGAGDGAAAPPDRGAWDKPGVTPDGRRTGSSTDGPRTPVDGEGRPAEDRVARDETGHG